ncbi:hypothetical protein [uncultured Thiodictyon sp.]|uniref:hypothetical protein n=1 Tax=uncultured Thiodictyon sp. TaxID=1846217 RepID=UPI0025D20D4B|nr:hypothetical protein [uncultured Thiodictyon sp.]
MTKTELLEWLDAVLGTADVDQGWRLVLVLVEWEPGAWRLGYSVPRYADAAEPGEPQAEWLVLGWLTANHAPTEPVCWPSLDSAAAEAQAIREAGLTIAPRQVQEDLLRVIVTDRPQMALV